MCQINKSDTSAQVYCCCCLLSDLPGLILVALLDLLDELIILKRFSWTSKSPRLFRSLYVCAGTCIQRSGSYSYPLGYTFCLYKASRSARGKRCGPSQVSLSCTQLCPCPWPSRFLGKKQSFTKVPVGVSIPRYFFLKILTRLWFVPSAITDSAAAS